MNTSTNVCLDQIPGRVVWSRSQTFSPEEIMAVAHCLQLDQQTKKQNHFEKAEEQRNHHLSPATTEGIKWSTGSQHKHRFQLLDKSRAQERKRALITYSHGIVNIMQQTKQNYPPFYNTKSIVLKLISMICRTWAHLSLQDLFLRGAEANQIHTPVNGRGIFFLLRAGRA